MEEVALVFWIVIFAILAGLTAISIRRKSQFYSVLFGANALIVLTFVILIAIPILKDGDEEPKGKEPGEYRLAQEEGSTDYHIVFVRPLSSGKHEIIRDLGKIEK